MKKHIITLVLALVGALNINTIAAGGGGGGGPLPTSILMKKDQILSRNLAKVAHVEGQMSAQSMLYSSSTKNYFNLDYTPSSGQAKASEILALIATGVLQFDLAKPEKDTVYAWSFVYDANWNTLFWGGTGFKLEPNGSGGWRVPAGASKVVLQPADTYYSIQYLSQVYFAERDNEGNIINYYSIDVWQNGFSFPSYLLGKRGELYLRLWNPDSGEYNTFAYDSETGERIVPSKISGGVTAEFFGMQSVMPFGDTIITKPVESYAGFGESNLVEATITTAGVYRVYQKTTEGELPDTIIIWRVGDPTEMEIDRVEPAQYVPAQLQPGMYHIRFVWPKLLPPNSGGGEKG